MGTLKDPKASSDRQKWQKIFDALVQMLRTRQTQIESLAKERKFLEERIKIQYDRWVSDRQLLKDQISQMRREREDNELAHSVDALKFEALVGLKEREAMNYKVKLDDAMNQLEDFKEFFGYLSRNCSETKETNAEMLALLSERDFVWNQFKKREADLVDRLKSKSSEAEQANEKIQELLTTSERLQSSNDEKDSVILKLKTSMAKLEAASIEKDEEISRLTTELQVLRKCKSSSATPTIRRAAAHLRDKKGGTETTKAIIKTESHPSRTLEKGQGSSKRKSSDEAVSISETPRLFTSVFKVPKLKDSSGPSVI